MGSPGWHTSSIWLRYESCAAQSVLPGVARLPPGVVQENCGKYSDVVGVLDVGVDVMVVVGDVVSVVVCVVVWLVVWVVVALVV